MMTLAMKRESVLFVDGLTWLSKIVLETELCSESQWLSASSARLARPSSFLHSARNILIPVWIYLALCTNVATCHEPVAVASCTASVCTSKMLAPMSLQDITCIAPV